MVVALALLGLGFVMGSRRATQEVASPLARTSISPQAPVWSDGPQGIIGRLQSLHSGSLPNDAARRERERLLAQLAECDPVAFLSLFEKRLANREQRDLLREAVATLTKRNPNVAVDVIRRLPGGWQQADAWEVFAQTGANEDPEAILALASQGERFRRLILKSLIDQWSEIDPAAAVARVSEAVGVDDLETWFRVVDSATVSKWLRQDPKAALKWFDSLPISESFRASQGSSLGHELRGQVGQVATMPGELRERVIDWIGQGEVAWLQTEAEVRRLMQEDPQAALEKALEAGEQRIDGVKGLITETLRALFTQDPQKAFAQAMALPSRQHRHAFFQEYTEAAAEVPFEELNTWVHALEDPASQAGALQGLMSRWVKEDFVSAMEALSNHDATTFSRDMVFRLAYATDASVLLGHQPHQEALATFLHSLKPRHRQQWVAIIQRNLDGNLPGPLQAFMP